MEEKLSSVDIASRVLNMWHQNGSKDHDANKIVVEKREEVFVADFILHALLL